MSLTEYAAAMLFIKAVDFLSRFQNIKLMGVNEVYHIQKHLIKQFRRENHDKL